MITDLAVGATGSFPQQFHYSVTGNTLYFRANDDNLMGAELWKYGPIILPIELAFFDATKIDANALLDWTTATETNNDRFIIERSTNGSTFEAIGVVDGAGNSNTNISYQFVDDNPNTGINYYRLKQVDFDGQFENSEIRTLYFEQPALFIVYPNPFTSNLFFEMPSANEQVIVQIHDMLGRLISKQHLMLEPRVKLQLDELKNGDVCYICTNGNPNIY